MKVQLIFADKYDKPKQVSVILESPGEIVRFIEILGEENWTLATLLGQMSNIRGFIDSVVEEVPDGNTSD
jgi:hypothetical protein